MAGFVCARLTEERLMLKATIARFLEMNDDEFMILSNC